MSLLTKDETSSQIDLSGVGFSHYAKPILTTAQISREDARRCSNHKPKEYLAGLLQPLWRIRNSNRPHYPFLGSRTGAGRKWAGAAARSSGNGDASDDVRSRDDSSPSRTASEALYSACRSAEIDDQWQAIKTFSGPEGGAAEQCLVLCQDVGAARLQTCLRCHSGQSRAFFIKPSQIQTMLEEAWTRLSVTKLASLRSSFETEQQRFFMPILYEGVVLPAITIRAGRKGKF